MHRIRRANEQESAELDSPDAPAPQPETAETDSSLPTSRDTELTSYWANVLDGRIYMMGKAGRKPIFKEDLELQEQKDG